ncbi:MAG: PAS domain S-box protein [Acidobacteria bacterium]|nr:PAS domain S-box protein [Acidobacteriota bacterium]
MSEFLNWLFESDRSSGGRTLLSDPFILWLQVASDLLIAVAALVLAVALVRFSGKRPGQAARGILAMFIVLMLAFCFSYLLDVLALWIPAYRFTTLMRLLVGSAALAAAVLLIPALSRAMAGPGFIDPKTDQESQGEAMRTPAAEEFRKLREELEQRVLERTARLRDSIQELKNEIAERKQATAALKESEARFRAMVDASPLGIFLTDAKGDFIYTNRVYQEITGQSFGDALGEGWRSVLHPEDRDRYLAQWDYAHTHARPYQGVTRLQRKEGTTVWVEVRAVAVRQDQSLSGYMGTLDDITESMRAEEALRASEERYRDLFENANDIVFTTDLEGRFTSVNKAGERLTGYARDEVTRLGLSFEQLVAPEHHALARELLGNKASGDAPANYELDIISKEGRRLGMEVSTRKMYQNGSLIGLQGIARDVTERKQLEDQLRQSQKMEAIGRLAGGVAHDFNNLLTAIMGYSDLLLIHVTGGDPLKKYLNEIQKAGERAASLTSQLLAFSRKQPFSPWVISLSTVLGNMDRMLRRLIGEDIEMQTFSDPELGHVRADPGQIEQVMMNLVVNARDAMPEGGKITIEMSNVYLDETSTRLRVDVKPGHYVLLTVSDTGCGIDPEIQSHLFETFFTTKGPGKGTGLGLAIVYGIVQQSNGHIWVYSEPGHGATFKIYLPRVDEGLDEAGPEELLSAPPQGTETILLVEDQDEVRALSREVLQMAGYTVLEASRGDQALDITSTTKREIHLLLTDIIMPRMSGLELSDRIQAVCPEIKVLYMSGYTDRALTHAGKLSAETPFLQKPFSPAQLVRKVRETLDA